MNDILPRGACNEEPTFLVNTLRANRSSCSSASEMHLQKVLKTTLRVSVFVFFSFFIQAEDVQRFSLEGCRVGIDQLDSSF